MKKLVNTVLAICLVFAMMYFPSGNEVKAASVIKEDWVKKVYDATTSGGLYVYILTKDNDLVLYDETNAVTKVITGDVKTFSYNRTSSSDFGIVLKNDGSVWTFGSTNNVGELGIGAGASTVGLHNILNDIKEVVYVNTTMYAVSNTGEVWAWGNGFNGLGTGDSSTVYVPKKVLLANTTPLTGIKKVVSMGTGAAVMAFSDTETFYWGSRPPKLETDPDVNFSLYAVPYTTGLLKGGLANVTDIRLISDKIEIKTSILVAIVGGKTYTAGGTLASRDTSGFNLVEFPYDTRLLSGKIETEDNYLSVTGSSLSQDHLMSYLVQLGDQVYSWGFKIPTADGTVSYRDPELLPLSVKQSTMTGGMTFIVDNNNHLYVQGLNIDNIMQLSSPIKTHQNLVRTTGLNGELTNVSRVFANGGMLSGSAKNPSIVYDFYTAKGRVQTAAAITSEGTGYLLVPLKFGVSPARTVKIGEDVVHVEFLDYLGKMLVFKGDGTIEQASLPISPSATEVTTTVVADKKATGFDKSTTNIVDSNVPLAPGPLDVQIGNVAFSEFTLKNGGNSAVTSKSSLLIDDSRGGSKGWSIKISATDFTQEIDDPTKPGGKMTVGIPASMVYYQVDNLASPTGSDLSLVTNSATGSKALDSTPQEVLVASKSNGAGSYTADMTLNLTFGDKVWVYASEVGSNYSVNDKIGAYQGVYKGTINFTIGAGI